MRSITVLSLLCSLLLSFSQDKITHSSHPFQILFVDNATYIGKQEPIKQFDFLSAYDLIRNNGELVLLHYSGQLLETEEKLLNVNELSNSLDVYRHSVRPLISNSAKTIERSNYIKIGPNDTSTSSGHNLYELIYPFYVELHNARRRPKTLHIKWKYFYELPEEHHFLLQIKNGNNEVLLKEQTSTNSVKIDLANIDFEDLILISIDQQHQDLEISQNLPATSSEFSIHFIVSDITSKHYVTTEYHLIVDALIADQKKMVELSNSLYSMAIEDSNQDPRFIQLYEDFLDRNPKFK